MPIPSPSVLFLFGFETRFAYVPRLYRHSLRRPDWPPLLLPSPSAGVTGVHCTPKPVLSLFSFEEATIEGTNLRLTKPRLVSLV